MQNIPPRQRQMLRDYVRFAARALLQHFERTGDIDHLLRLRDLLEDFERVT